MANLVSTNPAVNPYASNTTGYSNPYNWLPGPSKGVLGAATGPTGGGTAPAPANTSTNIPTSVVPAPDTAAIDGMYNDSYNYLNQAEGAVRSDYPNVLNEADSTYNTNKSILDTNNTTAQNQFNQQSTQADTRGQEALAANRRLYSDLNHGYQQRFGGASSAGQAANEIANVEQQRQQGQVYRGLQDTHQTINNQRTQVDGEYHNNLLQLEQQKQLAVNNATRDFQNKLLEISKSRADIGTSKAQANLQAMQDYRNKVFQINVQNGQFQQTLELQRQQAHNSLNAYTSSMNGGLNTSGQAFTNYANTAGNTNPSTQLQVNGTNNTNGATQYTGAISNQNQQQKQIIGYDMNGQPIYSQ